LKIICAVCKVKDDADVIESFCRYHLTFLDALFIWDDYSTDNTPEIIQCLIREGLSIELTKIPREQTLLRNFVPTSSYERFTLDYEKYGRDWAFSLAYLHARCMTAFEKYNADWVIPLDVDEFLYCENGQNPRTQLEMLDENTEYKLYWRTSVYCGDPTDSTVFLPDFFEEYRDPELERFNKTILSRHLVEELDGILTPGAHGISFPDELKRTLVQVIEHPALRVAHFPVRSTVQVMVKVICMQLRLLTLEGSKPFQYERIYNKIKEEGVPTLDQVRHFSLEYALHSDQVKMPVNTVKQFRGALLIDFLHSDIKLAYTNYQNKSYLNPILSYYELLLEKLKTDYETDPKIETSSMQTIKKLDDARYRIGQLEASLFQSSEELTKMLKQIKQLENSTCWRITKPLRAIMNMFRK